MRRPAVRAAWVLSVAAAFAGCTCGPQPGRSECGDFSRALDAWCGALERCPGVLPLGTKDRAACVDFGCAAFTCRVVHDDDRGEHHDTVEQRIPTRNADRVTACADFLATVACDDLEAFNPASVAVRRATRGARNPCDGLLESDDPQAFGAGAGAQCTVDRCAPGLFCAGASVNRVTAQRRCEACAPDPAENESCSSADAGCAPGLVCQSRLTARTCVRPFAEGTACSSGFQCASGSCDPVSSKCAGRKAEGTGCQRDEECVSGSCDLAASRTCRPGCRDSTACGAGQWCDAAAHACRPADSSGAPCSAHLHCASGFCGADATCADAPLPLRTEGEACASPRDCGLALECRNQRCERLNLACQPRGQAESCQWIRQCDEANRCDAPDLVCAPRKAAGEGCGAASDCASRLACLGPADAGICAEPLAEGAACDRSSDCSEGLRCEPAPLTGTLRCAAPPTGAGCGPSSACPPSHFCNAQGRCAPRSDEGAACSVGAPCQTALYCEQGTVCRQRRASGQTCGTFVTCTAGLRCSAAGACEAAGSVGAVCSATDGAQACAPGLFCDTFSSPAACTAQLGEGQACTRDAQCPSGACDVSFGCLATAVCAL